MSDPRYVIRELVGYPMIGKATAGNARPSTSVYVMDSWYGFVVVAAWTTARSHGLPGGGALSATENLARIRHDAAAHCADLNALQRKDAPNGRMV